MQTVLYSYGSKFGIGGLATTVYHDVRALHRHGMLRRLLCGYSRETDIPAAAIRAFGFPDRVLRKLAAYDRSQRLLHFQNLAYDWWTSRSLEPADLFIVWNTYGLGALARAKAMGMTTAVWRGSTHPSHADSLRADEYARWGLRYHAPAVRLRRKLAELSRADYILIPNPRVAPTFVRHGVPETKLVPLVGRGVDISRFVPGDRARDGTFRVLFVGAVCVAKGIFDLLQAWKRLGWTDAELWLVGQPEAGLGPLLQPFRALPGVRLLGYQPDPMAAYQQADVFALPTLDDASVKAVYEAMACGLPVITTAEATGEVRDGIEGFIIPARDADAIAARLDELRRNESLRRVMSRAARRRAEQFTWERYGEEFVGALRTLVSQ